MSIIHHDQRRVPPGFGEGKPWQGRLLVLFTPEGTTPFWRTAGMKVRPDLHESYFGLRKRAERAIAERARLSMPGPLTAVYLNESKLPRGGFMMLDSDGPDELAFIGCMLFELGYIRVAFTTLDVTAEEGRSMIETFNILTDTP